MKQTLVDMVDKDEVNSIKEMELEELEELMVETVLDERFRDCDNGRYENALRRDLATEIDNRTHGNEASYVLTDCACGIIGLQSETDGVESFTTPKMQFAVLAKRVLGEDIYDHCRKGDFEDMFKYAATEDNIASIPHLYFRLAEAAMEEAIKGKGEKRLGFANRLYKKIYETVMGYEAKCEAKVNEMKEENRKRNEGEITFGSYSALWIKKEEDKLATVRSNLSPYKVRMGQAAETLKECRARMAEFQESQQQAVDATLSYATRHFGSEGLFKGMVKAEANVSLIIDDTEAIIAIVRYVFAERGQK